MPTTRWCRSSRRQACRRARHCRSHVVDCRLCSSTAAICDRQPAIYKTYNRSREGEAMAKRATSGATTTLIPRARASRPRRIEALLGRDWKVALLFILPLVVIMVGLICWPFINAILLSFTTRNIVTRTDQFVGLRNYQLLWKDADFRGAVSNTVFFTVASVACKLVVGMTIALLLNSR